MKLLRLAVLTVRSRRGLRRRKRSTGESDERLSLPISGFTQHVSASANEYRGPGGVYSFVHVQPPLISKAFVVELIVTVAGPVMLLLSWMSLVFVLASLA